MMFTKVERITFKSFMCFGHLLIAVSHKHRFAEYFETHCRNTVIESS